MFSHVTTTKPSFAPNNDDGPGASSGVPQATHEAMADLGWPTLLTHIAALCHSPLGRQVVALMGPRAPIARDLMHQEVKEVLLLLRRGRPVVVGDVAAVDVFVNRAQKGGTCTAEELAQILRLITTAQSLAIELKQQDLATKHLGGLPALMAQVQRLPDLDVLGLDLLGALAEDGSLKDDASPALATLRHRARKLSEQIRTTLQARLSEPEWAHLLMDQFVSVRHGRFVLPIVAQHQSHVPGLLHNASQTGQTLFIEPEDMVPLGNALSLAQAAIAQEEARLLLALSYEVAQAAQAIGKTSAQLAQWDAQQAVAAMADQANFNFVEPTRGAETKDDGILVLKQLRHPLLVLANGTDHVVPSDVVFEPGQHALVISGPNAGGKTALMTAIGLSLAMHHAGMPICAAPGAQVPECAQVLCALGDKQNLREGLSSFSAQLMALKDMLARAGAKTWVLIDEIGTATDPLEGAALARAVLEALVDSGACVVVTSHLEPLKILAFSDPRFRNARMGLDATTLRPTFALQPNEMGRAWAMALAEKAGLPPAIIEAAHRYLGDTSQLQNALGALEAQQVAFRRRNEQLLHEQKLLAQQSQKLAAQTIAATRERQNHQADMHRQKEAVIADAMARMNDIVAQARKALHLAEKQRAQAKLKEAASGLMRKKTQTDDAATPSSDVAYEPFVAPRVGSRVRVKSLGQEGVALSVDEKSVSVAIGALHTRVDLRDVKALGPTSKHPIIKAKVVDDTSTSPAFAQALQTSASRLDVRGMRLDEAQRALARAMDQGLSQGAQSLWLVHGHGTGALRSHLRHLLEHSIYVAHWRPGTDAEGGDGVTVVSLDGQ